MTLFTRKWF